jgi:hypothetical protein
VPALECDIQPLTETIQMLWQGLALRLGLEFHALLGQAIL